MCTMRPSPTTTSSVPVLIAVSRASTAARRSAVRAVRISGLLALEISCGFMASGSLGTGVFVKWSWFLASFDLAFQRGQLGLIGGIGRFRFMLFSVLVECQIALSGLRFHQIGRASCRERVCQYV